MRWILLLGLAACADVDPDRVPNRMDSILRLTGMPDEGAAVFEAECSACHGADMAAIYGARPAEIQVRAVLLGFGPMPPYDGVLNDQEIADVVAYMTSLAP